MEKTIALMATLDTKGEEVKYLKEQIEKKGKRVLIIDMGTRGTPFGPPADITREKLAEASGSSMAVIEKKGRGEAIEIMVKGIEKVVEELYAQGRFQGIMAIGGMDAALLSSAGMRALPLGVPKLIVTPIAEGNEKFGTYVGTSDMIMMHSVVDILGINEISKKIFDNAVGAMVGMVDMNVIPKLQGRNVIAATMYGNTTPAVTMAKKILEEQGYEVVVFHPNGTGGRSMEELAEQGLLMAILDMTTHEIVDELFHGVHSAGPHRLEVAGKKGIPQVVVPGCVDFILLGPIATLPEEYKKRQLYFFNPAVTMVRTTHEEMVMIGKVMAEKLNKAVGPTQVLIPLGGFSMYCHEGEALYDPEGDRTFSESLKKHLKSHIPVLEVDAHINDPIFAQTAASVLIHLIEQASAAQR
ncbi:MAG: Tm-1-like ATP-binding domain-containing protein [Deltaproteobacteria bacterium]|nr:Tm-1-like ATP-binding domain-containing protein [Deltaproteobacteria bacterium]